MATSGDHLFFYYNNFSIKGVVDIQLMAAFIGYSFQHKPLINSDLSLFKVNIP